MKKMKFMALLTALAFVFSMPSAFANSLSDQDMRMAFGSDAVVSHQVTMLSEDEMVATEGAYGWWGAVAGWTTAAYSYYGASQGSDNWNWSAFGQATTAGAIAGAVLPTPTAVQFGRNIGVGYAAGYASASLWSWF